MSAPILSNVPGSFPESVLLRRHPAIIDRLGVPYPPHVRVALDRLRDERTIGRLPADAHDRAEWDVWGADHFGKPWLDAPFFWAESYFYRRLLDAVDYYRPGPWWGIDPFGPQKVAESPGQSELAELDVLQRLPEAEQAQALTRAAVWGNRADLGFRLVEAGGDRVETLVVDDGAALWRHVDQAQPGTVCVVADNAGRELLPDLVLVDFLLRTGRATHVELHVKPAPHFVSDATGADVLAELRRFPTGSAIGQRLDAALRGGTLSLHAPAFYCTPLTFHDLPADLAARFAAARLTVLKGDLNYRRLVGDRHWPAAASFQELTAYFPGPVAALRTLKSDVAVGLPDGADASRPEGWRTSGRHALIQFRR